AVTVAVATGVGVARGGSSSEQPATSTNGRIADRARRRDIDMLCILAVAPIYVSRPAQSLGRRAVIWLPGARAAKDIGTIDQRSSRHPLTLALSLRERECPAR